MYVPTVASWRYIGRMSTSLLGAASIGPAGSMVLPAKSVSTSVTAASDLMFTVIGCVGANQTLVGIRIEKNRARPDTICIENLPDERVETNASRPVGKEGHPDRLGGM